MAIKLKNRSFFVLLVKNYIVFTLALAIVAAAIIYSMMLFERNYMGVPKTEDILKKVSLLKSENYEKLNTKELFGNNGFFEIVNSEDQIIYSSDKMRSLKSYTQGELESIHDFFSSQYMYAVEYENEGQDGRILIEVSSYDKSTMQVEELGYLILDKELYVLEDTLGLGKSKFTQKEYSYFLNQDPVQDGLSIYKYNFKNKDGETFALIMHIDDVDEKDYEKFNKVYQLQIPIFLFFYVILIIFFIIWMNRKVKKPLEKLNNAILEFANGQRSSKVEYSGASEFVQISNSFNIMSEKLIESEKKKEKLLEERQKILADISHDLRTPITVIQGYAKAINDGMIAEEEKQRYLSTIFNKANVLAELIQIFSDYSKLEHPDFKLVLREIDFCEFLREYLAMKYDEIDMAGFELDVDIPSEPILWKFDEVQMKRVFENIIGNSLKHNHKGTTITISVNENADSLSIKIGDNGVGIPEGIQATLFDPFVVGDDSRNNKQGSGLGLAIVRKIVEAHRGTISLMEPTSSAIVTVVSIVFNREWDKI